jgi:hypothetical protein
MPRLFTALTCAALATLASAAAAPLPAPSTLSVEKAIETVACVGDRRNYRNFNHCWSVNIRRATPRAVSSYCSRICTAARK